MELNAAGTVTNKYIRGINLVAADNTAGVRSYYVYNGHGDTAQLTGASGNVIKSYDYDAFGNELNIDNNDTNVFRYAGEYFDKETGAIYLRARYYDPETGRFITEDTNRGKDSDPLSLNLYTYCANNPLIFVDPSGNSWITSEEAWKIWTKFTEVVNTISDTITYYFNFYTGRVGTSEEGGMVVYVTQEQADLNSAAGDILTGEIIGGAAGTASKVISGGVKGTPKTNPAGGGCFTAGTLVSTEGGQRPIEEVKVGDYVWSENPETGEKGLKKVVNTFIHDKYTLIHVYTGDTMIETTEEHPFWVEGKGWVFAVELNEGDMLRLKSGENVKVTKLECVDLKEPVKVYNFEVEDWHTYYVSDINVLVHNKAMKYNGVNKAYDVLEEVQINGGAAPKGYAGNVEYRNQPNTKLGETKIPNKNIANYTEYDVNEFNGWNKRGAERLVTGDDGSAWYTPDHYKTWIQIK